MSNPIDIAKDVLSLEIEGLETLRDDIDGAFMDALDLLRATPGRIVVTGIGKSGHIARKIAATFASTGATAMFVHPAEASHGDLGMISSSDVILALSKSGEATELRDLLAYAARFSIPVVAMTSAPGSTLAKAATVVLSIPEAREACGETRAPTTSTTMMMALGDALAVSLLRERGFTSDDFRDYHPGGNLGAALRRVSDLMHGADSLPLCTLDSAMAEVVAKMSSGGFGCVGVVSDDGQLLGMITDGDLRRHFDDALYDRKAADVMTATPRTANADDLAGDVLAIMSREKITALFVISNKKPIGIVHVHDCLSTGVL